MAQLPDMAQEDLSEMLEVLTRLKLELENRIATTTCSICMDARSSVMLMPCGHRNFCFGCVRKLRNRDCPICRQPFTSTVDMLTL